jgi:hypothetical protein
MWLDDAEYAEMMREIYTVLLPRRANAPKKGRTRRMIASVLMPADETPAPEEKRDQ